MRTRALLTAILVAGLATACSQAAKVECPPGWSLCDGTCRQLAADAENCGACGNACGAGQTCRSGACGADCTAQLKQPLRDPWGTTWDGLERAPAPLADARAACEAIGGRLPSLTELHRVSTARTGAVADVYQSNAIWSMTPASDTTSMSMRLSTGATVEVANTVATQYRCLCPAPAPAAFTGAACAGPPGEECFSFAGDPSLAYDAVDRPAATKAAAIWECAFSGGHLASPERLAAAISQGLPNASGAWLHTEDQATADRGAMVRWVDGAPWKADGMVETSLATTIAPFRCTGPARADLVSATTVEGGVQAPATHVVVDGAEHDGGALATVADAIDACFDAGGHLPTASALASTAMQGIPREGTAWLWSADEVQSNQSGTYAWTGTAWWPGGTGATMDGLAFAYPASLGLSAKTATLSYRCIYPRVDPAYAAPPECNGGCSTFERSTAHGTEAPARAWFDSADRAAATYDGGAALCATLGGRLPSARDLVEAIRHGLPGVEASTENVLTSDVAAQWVVVRPAYCVPPPWWCWFCSATCYPDVYGWVPRVHVIPQWIGTANATYAETAGADVTPATAARVRCMWTNEIR